MNNTNGTVAEFSFNHLSKTPHSFVCHVTAGFIVFNQYTSVSFISKTKLFLSYPQDKKPKVRLQPSRPQSTNAGGFLYS